MEPIIALTILLCVYAAGELIAQKSKAVFSTVLGIAILLLAGFWSGVLPRSVIEDAQVTGFGNVIAGILIVSLGTTIDFPELRRQWKVVVTSLVCVIGATLAIIIIGYPLIGKEMSLSVAPIFAGGSAATLIMTTALDEMGLVTASTLCIVMYVVQKFTGVPIASLLLRRTAVQFRENPALVAEYSQQQETAAGARRGPLQLPASFARPSVYLAKLGLVAVVAHFASELTGGVVHYFVLCLVMGAVFFALGCKYRRNVVEDDGTVVAKKFVDFTVNCDERICDGFYFATGLKYMRKFLAHPERLDEPPEQVLSDID